MARFNVERVQGYTIMSNYHLRDNRLSMKAKGLMSVMLSLPPEWDYSLRGLTAICRECQSSIAAMVRELEECGYIERYQERGADGKLGGCVYNIYEKPKTGSPSAEKPCTEKQHTVKPQTEKPCAEKQPQLNTYQLTTKKLNKEESNTQSINPAESGENKSDWIDRIEEARGTVKENIEYDKEQLDEIVELMTEVICSSRDKVTVGKQDMPAEAVRSRFLKINSEHIEYIFWSLKRNATKIRNIKAYLTTVLYNAPATISNFYAAEVNHDMNGGN